LVEKIIFETFPTTVEKFSLEKFSNVTGKLHRPICKFSKITRSVLLRIRTFTERICTGIQKAYLYLKIVSVNLALCEIMWKGLIDSDIENMIILYAACAMHAG